MKNTQLSNSLVTDKIILYVTTTVFVLFWIIAWSVIPLIFFLITLLVIVSYYVNLFSLSKNLSYDNSSLYITDKRVLVSIPFEDLRIVKLSWGYVSVRQVWVIKYQDDEKEKTVSFYPKYGWLSIRDFATKVRDINKNFDTGLIALPY